MNVDQLVECLSLLLSFHHPAKSASKPISAPPLSPAPSVFLAPFSPSFHLLLRLTKTKSGAENKAQGKKNKEGKKDEHVITGVFVSPPPQYPDPPRQVIERYCGRVKEIDRAAPPTPDCVTKRQFNLDNYLAN